MQTQAIIMNDLKCPKCGKVFGDNLSSCPNCSHPASQCSTLEENNDSITTDTGYKQEDTIMQLADGISVFAKGVAILIAILTLILFIPIARSISESLFILIIGTMIAASFWIGGLITKAFLYVYANISINIHEINMKTK